MAILEQLSEHARTVLAEFSRRSVPEDTRKQSADAAYSLENDALWTLCDRSYADWVCRLCMALLLRASSAKLAACRSVAVRKPAFAELLLPYALADLAAHDKDSSLLRTISAQVWLCKKPLCRCCEHSRGMKSGPAPSGVLALYTRLGMTARVTASTLCKLTSGASRWTSTSWALIQATRKRCGWC